MTELSEVSDKDVLRRYPILRFFEFDHLPFFLQETSVAFHVLAWSLARKLPYCAETSSALRKLLEAKDCAVRASLPEKTDD